MNAIRFGRKAVLLYGGAGDAELLDDFEELLRRALLKSRPGSLQEVAELIERRLRSFYRSEIGDPQDVSFVPIFGVSLPAKRACGAWIARRKRLLALRSWELLGLDYVFYKHLLRRLLPAKPTVAQAMLTALHVFETAGSTSTGIEAVPDVFFFDGKGAWREARVHVEAIQTNLLVLVANVIKHGEGWSAEELRKINPALFDYPGTHGFMAGLHHPPVSAPLAGGDLFVTDEDYLRYVQAIEALWSWLAGELNGRSWHIPKS